MLDFFIRDREEDPPEAWGAMAAFPVPGSLLQCPPQHEKKAINKDYVTDEGTKNGELTC